MRSGQAMTLMTRGRFSGSGLRPGWAGVPVPRARVERARAALRLPLRRVSCWALPRSADPVAGCSAFRSSDPVAESAAAAALPGVLGFPTAPSAVASPVPFSIELRAGAFTVGKLYSTRSRENVPELFTPNGGTTCVAASASDRARSPASPAPRRAWSRYAVSPSPRPTEAALL